MTQVRRLPPLLQLTVGEVGSVLLLLSIALANLLNQAANVLFFVGLALWAASVLTARSGRNAALGIALAVVTLFALAFVLAGVAWVDDQFIQPEPQEVMTPTPR